MDDAQRLFAKFEAAVYLYELTGDVNYKGFVESNYTSIIASYGPTQEDTDRQEALLYYAHLPGISAQVKSAILTKFVASVTRNADQLPMVTNNKDPYRSPIKDYTILGVATSRKSYERGYISFWQSMATMLPLQRRRTRQRWDTSTIFTASTRSVLFI
jgi:hypothetical protein